MLSLISLQCVPGSWTNLISLRLVGIKLDPVFANAYVASKYTTHFKSDSNSHLDTLRLSLLFLILLVFVK
jgi:hypothetical protein